MPRTTSYATAVSPCQSICLHPCTCDIISASVNIFSTYIFMSQNSSNTQSRCAISINPGTAVENQGHHTTSVEASIEYRLIAKCAPQRKRGWRDACQRAYEFRKRDSSNVESSCCLTYDNAQIFCHKKAYP